MGTKALNILNIKHGNLGCILVLEVKIDDSFFMLINIYNANTKLEQLHTLNDLVNILETFKDIQNKSVILGGDFNVISNPSLDSECGKPVIKGCVHYIFASLFFSLKESTCETRKNVFHFTSKVLFILKKIEF